MQTELNKSVFSFSFKNQRIKLFLIWRESEEKMVWLPVASATWLSYVVMRGYYPVEKLRNETNGCITHVNVGVLEEDMSWSSCQLGW